MSEKQGQDIEKNGDARCGEQALIISGRVLAEVFGVTIRSIQVWRNTKGLPSLAGRDRYDLGEVWAWREKAVRAEYDGIVSDRRRFEKAEADEKEQKALLIEMKRREREGELIEKTEAERQSLAKIGAVVAGLEALEHRLGDQLVGVEDVETVKKTIDREVRVLRELYATEEGPELLAAELARRIGAAAVKRLGRLKRKATMEKAIAEEVMKIWE